MVQAAACHADVLCGVIRIEQNQEGAADGRGENRVDGSAVGDALAVLLRKHQGVERVYRRGVPFADELLHRLVRPAHQPPPDFDWGNLVQPYRGGGHRAHLPLRHPLPHRHPDGRPFVGIGFALHHLQQARGFGLSVGHGAALRDGRRFRGAADTIVPSAADWGSLLVLASLCTVCLYILQIQVLKKVSAFTFNLTYNLEPIYSIILAMIIFGEAKDLNFSFYTGLGLIFLSVALQTYRIIGEMKK